MRARWHASPAARAGRRGRAHRPGRLRVGDGRSELAFAPVSVVLTFYTLGRSVGARSSGSSLVSVSLRLAAISAAMNDSLGNAVRGVAGRSGGSADRALLARRSRLSQQLAVAAEQLRAEQDHNAAQATAEERNRVARDLHDVVAHCVSVMVVQAGAARLVAAHDQAAADRALAVIGDCGRDAMADLRRIVGVLRRTDDPDFGRGAGLGDLRLIDASKPPVCPPNSTSPADANPPPAVDVVAYRVVQEALTNVVKHAGEGATADVAVRVGGEAVTVEVTNTHVAARPEFTRPVTAWSA